MDGGPRATTITMQPHITPKLTATARRTSAADARLPSAHRRSRRRGPRSAVATLNRSRRRGLPGDGGRGESRPAPSSHFDECTVLQLSIRGFISHRAELVVRLECLKFPAYRCLNRTYLDKIQNYIQTGSAER